MNEILTSKGTESVDNLTVYNIDKSVQITFHSKIPILNIDLVNGLIIRDLDITVPHEINTNLVAYPNPLNCRATIQFNLSPTKLSEINNKLEKENIKIDILMSKVYPTASNVSLHDNIITFSVEHFSSYSFYDLINYNPNEEKDRFKLFVSNAHSL